MFIIEEIFSAASLTTTPILCKCATSDGFQASMHLERRISNNRRVYSLVEALLGHLRLVVVVWTESDDKVAHVVGGQLHFNVDQL